MYMVVPFEPPRDRPIWMSADAAALISSVRGRSAGGDQADDGWAGSGATCLRAARDGHHGVVHHLSEAPWASSRFSFSDCSPA